MFAEEALPAGEKTSLTFLNIVVGGGGESCAGCSSSEKTGETEPAESEPPTTISHPSSASVADMATDYLVQSLYDR